MHPETNVSTEYIKLDPADSYSQHVDRAVEILGGGGIVAFPTETVYGLGAYVPSKKGMQRIRQIKSRSDNKPFTVHIAEPADANRYVVGISPIAKKLIRTAWPGPVTMVFQMDSEQIGQLVDRFSGQEFDQMYHKNSIGLRCPDNAVARALLAAAGGPVVAPSANAVGQAPATDGRDVMDALNGQIEMVLDAGPSKYGKPSSIVKVSASGYEVLREGVLAKRNIEKLGQVVILFVCTGNMCRSPMAEAMCKDLLAKQLGCRIDQLATMGYRVLSAGTFASTGGPTSSDAQTALSLMNIEFAGHKSQALTEDLINKADHVFVMTPEHAEFARQIAAQAEQKVQLLAEGQAILDPLGRGLEEYKKCAHNIHKAIEDRLQDMFGSMWRTITR